MASLRHTTGRSAGFTTIKLEELEGTRAQEMLFALTKLNLISGLLLRFDGKVIPSVTLFTKMEEQGYINYPEKWTYIK
jgi:hypothetical protein